MDRTDTHIVCSRNRFSCCCYLVHIGLHYCSSAGLIYFLYCLYSGRLISFRRLKCPIHSTDFKIRCVLACVVESQYICFIRRMSSIEVRQWLTENEDVFTEIPPSLYETNVDKCVPGRTTVHFFICVLCGLCLVVYLLLMPLHCSKHNQRDCTETVWRVVSWILLLTNLIRKKSGMVRNT